MSASAPQQLQPPLSRAKSTRASVYEGFNLTADRLFDRNDAVVVGEGYSKHIHAGYGGAFNEVTLNDTVTTRLRSDQEHLIALLRQRGAGRLLRGWRCELDPNGVGEVSFQDFCEVAGSLGYQGNAMMLFGQDHKSDTLTLSELAPHIGALVERFATWVTETFGGPTKMVRSFMTDGKVELTSKEFEELVRGKGFQCTDEEFAEIFSLCDLDNRGSLGKEDVLFLESDAATRQMEIFKLRMQRKDQRQHDLAQEYCKERDKDMSATHRLAPRPWLVRKFEQLPMVLCQRRVNWQIESVRREKQARRIFMQYLHGVYGNEIRAWRLGLDPQAQFTVSLNQLRVFCRRNDLALSIPDLWNSLDSDKNGHFDMAEVCAKQASVLAQFRNWAHDKYDACAAVWDCPEAKTARGEIEYNGTWASSKKMLLQPFVECLRNIGWPDIERAHVRSLLLSSLDKYGCGFVSRDDLQWLDSWKPNEWLAAEPDEAAMQELRELMLNTYGHALRAWRCVMDRDDSNAVNWDEFKGACTQLGFRGNAGGAWRVLDTDLSGLISLKEFDPPSAELLGSFKHWADYNFGSVELAFRVLDADQDGAVTFHELRRTCRRLKWSGDVRLFFECLDVDGHTSNAYGKRTITLDEIVFLDQWHMDVPEASEADGIPAVARPSLKAASSPANADGRMRGKRRLSRIGAQVSKANLSQQEQDAPQLDITALGVDDATPVAGDLGATQKLSLEESSFCPSQATQDSEEFNANAIPEEQLWLNERPGTSPAAPVTTAPAATASSEKRPPVVRSASAASLQRPQSQGSMRPAGTGFQATKLLQRPASQGSMRKPPQGGLDATQQAAAADNAAFLIRQQQQCASRPGTQGTVATSGLSTTACSDRTARSLTPTGFGKQKQIRWSQLGLVNSPYANKRGQQRSRRKPACAASRMGSSSALAVSAA
mmetsp:Transcript_67312/g.161380  ORF Transcript_67312/g.161380 Transcript_67312/m.161380 type:complete len:939 (+) Transcript_67312:149-2965(+)